MSEEEDYKKFIEMTKLVLSDPVQKENEERLLLALDVTEEEFLKYSYELEKLTKTYGSNKKELTK